MHENECVDKTWAAQLASPSNETAIKFVPTKYALQIPSKWWKAIFYDFRFSLRSTLLLSVPGHDTLCTQALTGLTPNVNIYRENGNLLLFQLKLENRTGCTNRPHQLWFPANHPRRAHISRMHWETNQTVNKARKLRVKRLAINGFCADCGHPKKKIKVKKKLTGRHLDRGLHVNSINKLASQWCVSNQ